MRYILPLLFCLACTQMLNAQTCTPVWPYGNTYGMSPDTIQNLPVAYAGNAYNTAIVFKVKPDTQISLAGFPVKATINSVTVDSVSGFPPGLSFKCNPSNCIFKGDSTGCVDAYGTPPVGSEGLYKIIVHTTISITAASVTTPVKVTFTGYKIQVAWPTSVTEIPVSELYVSAPAPNPANTESIVSLFSAHAQNVEYMLFDMTGRRILDKTLSSVSGQQNIHIPVSTLPTGTYIIYVQTAEGSYKSPLVVNHY